MQSDNVEGEVCSPSRIDRFIGGIAWVGAAIAALLVLMTLVVVGYSVIMRYLLGTPITWADELSGYFVVAIVMLGAADTLRSGEHISVDLLTSKLAGMQRRIFAIWWMLAVVTVAAAIIYSAVIMVRFSFDFGFYSEGYLEMPMWIPQSVLLAGAVLLLAVALGRIMTLLLAKKAR